MALVTGQSVKIFAAGVGVLLLVGLMGYISYSGAQRHRELRTPPDYDHSPASNPWADYDREGFRARDRARELRAELDLSDIQYERVKELLETYGYAYRRVEWRTKQEEFYAAFAEILDERQRELLRQWRERRSENPSHWYVRPRNRPRQAVNEEARPDAPQEATAGTD